MSQTKLLKLANYPTNFLFGEYLRFDVNYMHPIELPVFPGELKLNTTNFHKSLEEISNFAVSKYLIQDIVHIKPKNILKSFVSTPQKMFTIISQAKSNHFLKND